MILKRLFDIVLSIFGILFLIPILLVISILIVLDSRGDVFFIQKRVGKNNIDFSLYKFRTMSAGSEKKGLLTVGAKDNRITKIGYYLRKYKLDELPQLFNVLFGDMSLVGPRPEVRKYVDLYTDNQKEILKVRPGITDYASIEYFNENEVLAKSSNPEQTYIDEIMPHKVELNRKYISEIGVFTDCKIIMRTISKIFK